MSTGAGRALAGIESTVSPTGEGHRPPRLSALEAATVAFQLYGLQATPEPLPSERDQNFRLRTERGDFVLKFSQTNEDPGLLDCQNQLLDRLAGVTSRFRFPRLLRTHAGEATGRFTTAAGATHAVRLLDWVPGRPLAGTRPLTPDLLTAVGALMGEVDRALEGFTHPGAQRELYWDLRQGRTVIATHLGAISDRVRRARVESFLQLFDMSGDRFAALRTGVIHGDGNDYNILVGELDADDPQKPIGVTGLLDFGDVMHSWIAGEVAIAAAYAALDSPDPVSTAAHVVHGYHAVCPLPEVEIEALFPLLCLRLCMSVVLSAEQRRQHPENVYLSVSEAPAWACLERLAGVHPRFAACVLRQACGLPPSAHAVRVSQWLKNEGDDAFPVLGVPPAAPELLTLELGIADTLPEGPADASDLGGWDRAIFGAMHAAGADIGIGRYDEVRRWYTTDAFRVETAHGPEWRTVHLGIDLFVTAGTDVFAPLAGIVESVQDNAGLLDYGPTIILRHTVADGLTFWTLYGHLSPDCLSGLRAGEPVERGQRIGEVGRQPGNGGWPPHLHVQVVTDLFGFEGTFPGVARPGQRALWLALSPDPNLLLRLPGLHPAASPDAGTLRQRRDRSIGSALSIAYRRPLTMVRGWRQFLYDEAGQPFLDAVNNVAHVGHCHPHVVAALERQSRVLNTNTRYLHENLVRYAERLSATLPEPLRVCFFVCSGSEANELALRMARAHTARHDVLVLDGAYHGNTSALIELSPYKFNGPGGEGRAAHVHVAPAPDPYRGPFRGNDAEAGHLYAAAVERAMAEAREAGRPIGAFFAEALPGCAGQIVPPAGFLAQAFAAVRAAGGVCVADEVQTGMGRVGSHFWAFQEQNALPDIVTVGKPIGNGHPLGAVITSPAIAALFANGMEYFNTFGGNPVSCAVGMAVLDVIEVEQLQSNALRTGEQLQAGLRALMRTHERIGDVRGRGLYVGVELVRDRATREPAGRHAAHVANRMRESGILISTDGPFHNVLKIKPPLVFGCDDANRLVGTLDAVLREDALQPQHHTR